MKSKIDGIQSLLIAKVAEEARLDFMGFVFDREHEDYIDAGHARIIRGQLQGPRIVGIFRDASAGRINSIAERVKLDYIELCGEESPEFARKLELPVIRHYRYDENFSVADANAYPSEMLSLNIDVLLQGSAAEQKDTLEQAAKTFSQLRKSCFLEGDIKVQNLRTLERAMHPYGISVRCKDLLKHDESLDAIKGFLKKVR